MGGEKGFPAPSFFNSMETSNTWKCPAARAALCGTCDDGSVLGKLRAQSHLLDRVFPAVCSCMRLGGTHWETEACEKAKALESVAATDTEGSLRKCKTQQQNQREWRYRHSVTRQFLSGIPRPIQDAIMLLISLAVVWSLRELLLCIDNSIGLRHLVAVLLILPPAMWALCCVFFLVETYLPAAVDNLNRVWCGGRMGEAYLARTTMLSAVALGMNYFMPMAHEMLGTAGGTSSLWWWSLAGECACSSLPPFFKLDSAAALVIQSITTGSS